MDSDDDRALLEQTVKNGDREAFNRLFARYSEAAYSLAFHITHDHGSAEDAVQQAMLKIWTATWTHPENARGWIMSIVAHESLRILKKSRKGSSTLEADDALNLHDDDASPSGREEQKELLDALRGLLLELPALERRILALHYGGNLSQAEIGAALGKSQQAVAYRLKHVLERLRGKLAQSGFTAAAPLLAAENLRDALHSGFPAPPSLLARVESGLEGARTAGAAKPAAWAPLVLAAVVIGGAVAGGAYVYGGAGTVPAPNAPPAPASLAPPKGTPAIAMAKPLRSASWSSRDGTLEKYELMQGKWLQGQARGIDYPILSTVGQNVAMLMPLSAPGTPCVVTVRIPTILPKQIVPDLKLGLAWTDTRRRPPNEYYNDGVGLGEGLHTVSMLAWDRYILYMIDGRIWSIARYETPYPCDRLMLLLNNYLLEEISWREVSEAEARSLCPDPDAIAGSLPVYGKEPGAVRKVEPERK